mgnify:CR=1 FL=1
MPCEIWKRTGAGGRKEADSLFQRAVEANPNDAVTVGDYGRFKLVCEKNEGEAEVLLRKAVGIDGGCVVALYNLGQLLFLRGEAVEAEECFRGVLGVDVNHVEALRYMGKLWKGRDRGKCEAFFKKAILSLEGKLSSSNSASTKAEILAEMRA